MLNNYFLKQCFIIEFEIKLHQDPQDTINLAKKYNSVSQNDLPWGLCLCNAVPSQNSSVSAKIVCHGAAFHEVLLYTEKAL